jgi:molybdopterin/thiamine biosynthesis adenylyltransferase
MTAVPGSSSHSDDAVWSVSIWPAASRPPDAALTDAIARGDVRVHDSLEAQIRELVDVRIIRRSPATTEEIDRGVAGLLDDLSLEQYGNWVHYPWARRIVRVLPQPEFRELRSSRNRNKITRDEQRRLQQLDLAIVGLSVGRATAITLALEGVGGRFRLADFDVLALSNMNRLHAGVHEIGVNKAVLTARTLLEIDPYLELSVHTEGVTTRTLEPFLTDGGHVDLLFEECDDLEMKVRIRDACRRLRIPVVMETSDRGMLDIERFDLEPKRPSFHGLAGTLDADALRGLDTYQKVPVVSAILGLEKLSRRMAASLVDIDADVKTWPQLASAVALGGALNTEAARRIVLGDLRTSARYYVDLEEIVRDGSGEGMSAVSSKTPSTQARPVHPKPLPGLQRHDGPVTREELHTLVDYAVRAPSGGNCQPWAFELEPGELRCYFDPARSTTLLDGGGLASYLACGAAAEHVVLAATALGLETTLSILPDGEHSELVFRACFSRPSTPPTRDPLVDQIEHRCTNRRRQPRAPLRRGVGAILEAQAQAATPGAALALVEDDARLERLGSILARGEKQRLLCERMHRELFEEIRWTREDVLQSRDGIDIETLELDATERAALTILSSWDVMATLRTIGAGRGLERLTTEAVASASAVGVLSHAGDGPGAFFSSGRALARVWLKATMEGIAMQPMTSLSFMIGCIRRGQAQGLAQEDADVLLALGDELDSVVPLPVGHARAMLFRLAPHSDPTARSLRRCAVRRTSG